MLNPAGKKTEKSNLFVRICILFYIYVLEFWPGNSALITRNRRRHQLGSSNASLTDISDVVSFKIPQCKSRFCNIPRKRKCDGDAMWSASRGVFGAEVAVGGELLSDLISAFGPSVHIGPITTPCGTVLPLMLEYLWLSSFKSRQEWSRNRSSSSRVDGPYL